MLVFYRPYTDPYFNIAAEEYFVKNSSEDICMIWISEPSVIIGKHQNAFAEINYPYVRKNRIPVIRRISGGGAVYHDIGNLNFSFVKRIQSKMPVDFSQFTLVIIQFMQSLGIEATTNKRNSLFTGNLKFSGHAEHIFHDKVLHHGTLLFDSDLKVLQNCLTPVKEFQSKALLSVRSEVGNLAPLLPEITNIQQFASLFIEWLIKYFPESRTYSLTCEDIENISGLAVTKYETWQWNFGYSPLYSFLVEFTTTGGKLALKVKVENGIFSDIEISGSSADHNLQDILSRLRGIAHKEEAIGEFVKKNRNQLELQGINTVTFSEAFFS